MGDYLKLFEKHSEYESYSGGGEMLKPNVSYCEDNNEVHYNPYVHDYSQDYLAFVALENGTISFNILSSMGTDKIESISYSTDNGTTWTTTPNQDNKEDDLEITLNVNTGDTILWKGTATQTGYFDEDEGDYVGSFFSSSCEFDAKGNVMSLLYGDNFKGEVDLTVKDGAFNDLFNNSKVVSAENLSLPATTLENACYQDMFDGCTSLATAPVLPATTLASSCYLGMFYRCTSLTTAPVLPATTLASSCYYYMFQGCTSLTTAPVLPATTLASSCYIGMFQGCTSLTTAPVLPATTLASSCYQNMFMNCTSLTTAPVLPATTLAEYCYQNMFKGCTALTTAPVLPATTLSDYCYSGMFEGCTSLTTAPVLPATTLNYQCYLSMFNGCTSLTTAPELPATTLADYCYQTMFYGCTSLTTAPELPATTLVNYCYQRMFQGCTSLNYIKAMFTTAPSSTRTGNWVSGVSSSGTFVKNSAATWNVTGVNGIPSGWTVKTVSA